MSEKPPTSQAASASSRCLICRYDRAGFDDATPCPECGNSAFEARALWAHRLRTSAWITLIACLTMPVTWFVPRFTQDGWIKMAIALLPILALIAAALALRGRATRPVIVFALASITHVGGWIGANTIKGVGGTPAETIQRLGIVALYASVVLTLVGILQLTNTHQRLRIAFGIRPEPKRGRRWKRLLMERLGPPMVGAVAVYQVLMWILPPGESFVDGALMFAGITTVTVGVWTCWPRKRDRA